MRRVAAKTAPTLFLTVLGMMFTGALLQRVTVSYNNHVNAKYAWLYRRVT